MAHVFRVLFVFVVVLETFHAQDLSKLIGGIYDKLYHNSVHALLPSANAANPSLPSELVHRMHTAAVLSRDVYSGSIADAITICEDGSRRPECVVTLREGDLWVVVRGTSTATDLLRDMTWTLLTKYSDDVSVPLGVLGQANRMTTEICKLIDSRSGFAAQPIRRILFTGHSLGGSIATLIYMNMLSKKRTEVPMSVFTFGSPFVVAETRNGSVAALKSLGARVYNVVYQLDIVPRLLGGKTLPEHLIMGKVQKFQNSRQQYSALGKYIGLSRHGRVRLIEDVEDSLAVFPRNEVDFAYALLNDHSMSPTVTALQRELELLKRER